MIEKTIFIPQTSREVGKVGLVERFGSEETILAAARVCRGVIPGTLEFPAEKNAALLKTLYKNRHFRPFEFAGLMVWFHAPIYVERQLRTYRKPDIERSLRACEPLRPIDAPEDDPNESKIVTANKRAFQTYAELVEAGTPKEEARRVLPLDALTEWVSFFTVRSLFHVFEERLDKAAQLETRLLVRGLYQIAKEQFPNIWR